MTVSASTQIPKTSDPAVFQRQCKVLFEYALNDPHIEEFGTSGQRQRGIDLLGRRRDRGLDHWVGIQCKLTIKSEKLKTGKTGVVEVEATRALAFEPVLRELIIATTASNDAEIQREAALFTDRQAKVGRDFIVQVWGWETLLTYILRDEATLKAFYPDAFPQTDRIIRGQDKLIEEVGSLAAAQNTFAAQQESMHALLVRVEQQNSRSITQQTISDVHSVGTLLDRQIDQLRDILNAGRPQTALGLLEGLWAGLPESVESRVRFRIKANIAACLLRLGDERKAAETYLEAYEYAPTDPKAIALKVFAHLLRDQPSEALAFGRSVFTGGAGEGQLVAYMIAASKLLPDEADPLQFITSAVADDPAVALAKINYLRSRNEPGTWWQFAKESHARHPEDENLACAAAEADIDRAVQWAEANDRRPLNNDLRAQVTKAAAVLQHLLDKFISSEIVWSDYQTSLSVNLTIGYRLLRQQDDARKVVNVALIRAPNDHLLKQALLTITVESGDYASASQALAGLPESRDVSFARFQMAANSGDWAAIVALHADVDLASFDTDDRALLEALTLLAKAKLGQIRDSKAEADALLQKFPNEPIVATVLYQLAVQERDGAWATELFHTAFAMRNQGNSATRMMLARLAEREYDADKVIDLLDGHVDVTQDSEELRSLARAFVNATVRQTSLSFINALPPTLTTQAFYARAIGSIHYNRGDLTAAESFFQQAVRADPTDVTAHMGLINTWLRQDRRDLVGPHLDGIDLDTLNGPPTFKMGLAQIFVAFERTERGLSFGYDVAVKNRGDQRTVMLYIGLILPNPRAARIPSIGTSIGVDCWVKAERVDGRILTFVIEEDATDRRDPDHFSPDHPLARLFLGQPKNATVVSTPTIGTQETWRVVEFKHKYLALLHEFIETLPSRFPDAKGFHRFEISGDDLSNLFAEVKRIGEQDEHIFRQYIENGFPLALVASFRGKSTVEFAHHVGSRGEYIRTCVGTNEERDAAKRLVRAARTPGIILDTYTAWVAMQLDLLGTLNGLFPRVALPRSGIDELRDWKKRMEPLNSEPLTTIGYANGQYFREEIPVERLHESVSWIGDGIEKICNALEILPAAAPGAPSELEQRLLDIGRYGLLDPVYASLSEDLLLVSDDMHYRVIARELHSREGAWLQAVLMVALETGALDRAGYAEAVCGLAARRHDHVSLNASTLIQIVLSDESDNFSKLTDAATFIGNENADFQSHYAVAWEFLVLVWRTSLPDLRKARASSIMLDRLVGMLARSGTLKEAYLNMVESSRRQPLLRDHLISWARGHFLNIFGA